MKIKQEENKILIFEKGFKMLNNLDG